MFKQNYKILGEVVREKSLTKYFIGKKGNGQIKRMIRWECWLFLTRYMRSYPIFVPNFEILGAVVPKRSLIQISLCIPLEWEMEKREKKVKRSLRNFSIVVFFYTTLCRCIAAEKSVTKNFIGEKEKNDKKKRNDKNENADSLLHDTRSRTQCLYAISKS